MLTLAQIEKMEKLETSKKAAAKAATKAAAELRETYENKQLDLFYERCDEAIEYKFQAERHLEEGQLGFAENCRYHQWETRPASHGWSEESADAWEYERSKIFFTEPEEKEGSIPSPGSRMEYGRVFWNREEKNWFSSFCNLSNKWSKKLLHDVEVTTATMKGLTRWEMANA